MNGQSLQNRNKALHVWAPIRAGLARTWRLSVEIVDSFSGAGAGIAGAFASFPLWEKLSPSQQVLLVAMVVLAVISPLRKAKGSLARLRQGGIKQLEPTEVASRAHHILRLIADTIFPADGTIQITIFVPKIRDGAVRLYPFIRFFADDARRHQMYPKTKVNYFDVRQPPQGDSVTISDAWADPNNPKWVRVCPDLTAKSQRKGWFLSNPKLFVSERAFVKLSDRTVSETKCLMDVAAKSPLDTSPAVLLSFNSTEDSNCFDLDSEKKDMLARYLESIAILFLRVGDTYPELQH